jgi:hypothetical protein
MGSVIRHVVGSGVKRCAKAAKQLLRAVGKGEAQLALVSKGKHSESRDRLRERSDSEHRPGENRSVRAFVLNTVATVPNQSAVVHEPDRQVREASSLNASVEAFRGGR